MSDLSGKKIIYVITKANWGGAQRYVYDLATHLPNDCDVSVVFGQPGLLAQKLTATRIKTHLLTSLQRDISVFSDLKSFFELFRLFKTKKPDVVHLNSSKAGGVGALAARLSQVPHIIFTAHGWPFTEKRSIAWRIFAFLGSWATGIFSHKIIVVSNADLHLARRMGFGNKTVRIYNGIEQMTLGTGEVIRKQFPSHARITGTIGELTPNKNQEILIDEAAQSKDMYVAIVGEGEYRERLEWKIKSQGLENRVKLFGFMKPEEVLRGFDVFALPSLKEGLPYVLLEAKSIGLPIEARRVGGVGEIIDAVDMSEFTLDRMVEKTIEAYY